MELAGERIWEDITITDIATRANLSLADFRDAFPSKGAVLAAFSRKIDRVVLQGTTGDMAGEPAKERLFDVLMRRLDALAHYKLGLEGIDEWTARSPLAAAAVTAFDAELAARLAADWPAEPLLVPHRVWAMKAERPM